MKGSADSDDAGALDKMAFNWFVERKTIKIKIN